MTDVKRKTTWNCELNFTNVEKNAKAFHILKGKRERVIYIILEPMGKTVCKNIKIE